MVRTIAPFGVRAKVRFSIGILLATLLFGCRSRTVELSTKPSESAPLNKEQSERPQTEKFEASAARPKARPDDSRDFGMVRQLRAPDAQSSTLKDAARQSSAASSSSSAPKAAPAPKGAPPIRAGGTLASAQDLGARGGAGYGVALGFGAGTGRLGGAHRARPSFAMNTESYAHRAENDFTSTKAQPLSTFSADVDTASYSNVRRFLKEGQLPPPAAVRVEEMLNYFDYEYPEPPADAPFGVYTKVTEAPWKREHRLVHIGIKTAPISQEQVPARNLVFLLDVSGSMQSPDKLPLLLRSLDLLVPNLREQDKVSIVVYAGQSGVVLAPTSGENQDEIKAALRRLTAGGSTNGAAGITEAYSLAQQNFKKEGINRVILATDGDFNVGTTSEGELVRLIENERKKGVFLTVLGFGRGNLKDSTMEMLADKGNGNYAYIDSLSEARKVLVEESGATLVTVARDVKFQLEFNPAVVESYRLVGYENRMLQAQDFNDDKKDAGEVGAGHSVTALYEVVPVGMQSLTSKTDPLKYQKEGESTKSTGELATLKLRYKAPTGATSKKLEYVVPNLAEPLSSADPDHRWAVAVAEFGLFLKKSEHAPGASLRSARTRAAAVLTGTVNKDRAELVQLILEAERLSTRPAPEQAQSQL
jgi:Ca-activated chloride channel family protein